MVSTFAPLNKIVIRSLGGDKRRGIIQAGALRLACTFGGNGIKAQKREGDFATPLAKMKILGGFYKNKRQALPLSQLSLRRLHKHDGWCDSVKDANYNRFVRLPYPASAENLYRKDNLYDVVLILDWNIKPRVKGRGSAIFLHIARPQSETIVEKQSSNHSITRPTSATSLYHPTAGCIAISPQAMRQLLPLLHTGTTVEVLG